MQSLVKRILFLLVCLFQKIIIQGGFLPISIQLFFLYIYPLHFFLWYCFIGVLIMKIVLAFFYSFFLVLYYCYGYIASLKILSTCRYSHLNRINKYNIIIIILYSIKTNIHHIVCRTNFIYPSDDVFLMQYYARFGIEPKGMSNELDKWFETDLIRLLLIPLRRAASCLQTTPNPTYLCTQTENKTSFLLNKFPFQIPNVIPTFIKLLYK